MLNIDTEKMLIELTRGDTANIVFSAKTDEGETYVPTAGDKLKFSVAKKLGATPMFFVENVMVADADAFWNICIGDPSHTDWFQKNEKGEVIKEQNARGEEVPVLIKTGDYVFDVQLTTSSGVDTIIGKTDSLSPTFRVWGEVGE